jgi:capsular exopolysaccharide synthesis family protein
MNRDDRAIDRAIEKTGNIDGRLLHAVNSEPLSTGMPHYIPHGESHKPHLRDYLEILLRRKWLVIGFLMSVVAIVAVASFLMKPSYRATTSLQIRKVSPSIVAFKNVFQADKTERDYYLTQYEILRSRNLAQRVIKKMPGDMETEMSSKGIVSSAIGAISGHLPTFSNDAQEVIDEQKKENKLIDSFIKRLDVIPVKTSQLVNISFVANDPKFSANVANAIADEYLLFARESKIEPTLEARERLEKEVDSMRKKLKASEKNLHQHIAKSRSIFLNEDKDYESHITKKLSKLFEELDEATSERISREAIYREVKKSGIDYSAVLQNPVIQSLTIEYTNLESEYYNLLKVHKPAYPKMVRLNEQIDQLKDRIGEEEQKIVNSLDSDYKIALKREMFLSSAIKKLQQDVTASQQNIIQLQMLNREVETNRNIYNSLVQRLKELGVSAALTESNIQIIDRAEAPYKPFKPRKALNIILSLIIGLFGGILLAFFTEYFDNSVKTVEDIEYRANLPVLGMVPVSETNPIELISAHSKEKEPFADAFKSISTFIQFKNTQESPRQILITSPLPRDGKTISAVNVAKSFSSLYGKGIIVDADLRKPNLHAMFNLDNSTGLSSFLSGAPEPGLINKVPGLGFDVITAGPVPTNPSELLNSLLMKELINSLSTQYYKYIIIDSPPVLGIPDTLILSTFIESVLVICRSAITPRDALAQTIKSLNDINANVLGVVLNGQDNMKKYGYSYGYSYPGDSYGHKGKNNGQRDQKI